MRKILKKLHLYLALFLCIPLVLQGLSGSILSFRAEISNAILHNKYQLAEGEINSEENIINAAKNVAETNLIPAAFKMPKQGDFAKVRFVKEGEKKPVLEVILDPISLQIFETNNPKNNFFRLVKKFHEDLFIEGKIGKNIVGIYGIVMLFMCFSGLVIWWPKAGMLKRALTFKFADTGKKFHRDLHGAVGFWLLIPFTAVCVTGIYLIYFKSKESSKLWHSIHDGTVAGIYGESLSFVIGFLPLLFSITGIALWWLKKKSRANKI